jgi:uncharacterized protein (AIM24 family)
VIAAGETFVSELPVIMVTKVGADVAAGVSYHLDGELAPVLTVDVSQRPVFFEQHILFWKHPDIHISLKPMPGVLKRFVAGVQMFILQASGPGCIAFSRSAVGQIVPIRLAPGQTIHVRAHQFLAATGTVDYGFEMVSGLLNRAMGETGAFLDRFSVGAEEGIVWLHGHGNVFEKTLAEGESIEVQPLGWLYKDPSVRMETDNATFTSGFLGSNTNFIFNRLTGPGRVGLQSMLVHTQAEYK